MLLPHRITMDAIRGIINTYWRRGYPVEAFAPFDSGYPPEAFEAIDDGVSIGGDAIDRDQPPSDQHCQSKKRTPLTNLDINRPKRKRMKKKDRMEAIARAKEELPKLAKKRADKQARNDLLAKSKSERAAKKNAPKRITRLVPATPGTKR
jgi:hypothetical protein